MSACIGNVEILNQRSFKVTKTSSLLQKTLSAFCYSTFVMSFILYMINCGKSILTGA